MINRMIMPIWVCRYLYCVTIKNLVPFAAGGIGVVGAVLGIDCPLELIGYKSNGAACNKCVSRATPCKYFLTRLHQHALGLIGKDAEGLSRCLFGLIGAYSSPYLSPF